MGFVDLHSRESKGKAGFCGDLSVLCILASFSFGSERWLQQPLQCGPSPKGDPFFPVVAKSGLRHSFGLGHVLSAVDRGVGTMLGLFFRRKGGPS